MVYHGKGDSRAVSYEIGTVRRTLTSQREIEVELPEGARICLDVMNAHTPLFSYDLRTAVDSTEPKPPEFGNVLTLLNAAVPVAKSNSASTPPAGSQLRQFGMPEFVDAEPEIQGFYYTYKERLDSLEADVRRVREAVLRSARPEELRPVEVRVVTDQPRGLGHAQQVMAQLPDEPGRFNDPKLGETIATWQREALEEAGKPRESSVESLVINSMHARSVTLAAARNALLETYSRASAHWRDCRALRRGKTTLSLAVRPRDTTHAVQRDTGSIFTVVAKSDYPRNVVELVPLAFVAFPRNVTGFGIENNLVVEDTKYAEDASVRLGTMLTTSPFRFGPTSEWAVGPGIGTGIIGGDKPALSDFFLGGLVSWRDWIRLGAGYGFSQAPVRLKEGARVGERLPLAEGRESLNDFIEQKRVGTWFLSFTLAGLKLNP